MITFRLKIKTLEDDGIDQQTRLLALLDSKSYL